MKTVRMGKFVFALAMMAGVSSANAQMVCTTKSMNGINIRSCTSQSQTGPGTQSGSNSINSGIPSFNFGSLDSYLQRSPVPASQSPAPSMPISLPSFNFGNFGSLFSYLK